MGRDGFGFDGFEGDPGEEGLPAPGDHQEGSIEREEVMADGVGGGEELAAEEVGDLIDGQEEGEEGEGQVGGDDVGEGFGGGGQGVVELGEHDEGEREDQDGEEEEGGVGWIGVGLCVL